MQTGKIVQVMGPVVDVLFEVCHGSSTAHRKQYGSLYYAEFQ